MKKLILLMLSVLVTESVWSQVNSTDTHELASNENTRSELIQKCRNSIVDAIIEGDRDKATELMLYAKTTFDDDNYQTFTPDELWDLTIWLRKYKMAASEMAQFSLSAKQIERNKTPFVSNLLHFLKDSICNNIVFLESDINSNISLTSCERDFLLLYIKNFKRIPTYEKSNGTLMNNSGFFNPDSLNISSNEFLKQYPGSEFEPFVKTALRYEYKKKGLMYGCAVSFGTASVEGDSINILSGSVCVGVDLNLSYNNIVAGVQMNISTNHKCQVFFQESDGTRYMAGAELFGISPNFYLGYWFRYHELSILPSIGYGGFRLDENSMSEVVTGYLKSDRKPVLSLEVGYGKPIFVPADNHVSSGRMALGLRYSYQPINFHLMDGDISGVMHRVTLCYRISAGKLKRVY